MEHRLDWAPSSWRRRPALQMPAYADQGALQAVEQRVSTLPALIFAGEIAQLRAPLDAVARGEAFLLQGGDCRRPGSRALAQWMFPANPG